MEGKIYSPVGKFAKWAKFGHQEECVISVMKCWHDYLFGLMERGAFFVCATANHLLHPEGITFPVPP